MTALLDHILVPALVGGALLYLLGRRFLSKKSCRCSTACCSLASRKTSQPPLPKK
jgi:hypothetical protein